MRLTGAQWVHCTIYRHNLLASLVLRPSHYPVTSCSMEKWRGKADIVDYTNDYLDGQRSNDHFCVVLVIPLDSSKANRKDGMGEPWWVKLDRANWPLAEKHIVSVILGCIKALVGTESECLVVYGLYFLIASFQYLGLLISKCLSKLKITYSVVLVTNLFRLAESSMFGSCMKH